MSPVVAILGGLAIGITCGIIIEDRVMSLIATGLLCGLWVALFY